MEVEKKRHLISKQVVIGAGEVTSPLLFYAFILNLQTYAIKLGPPFRGGGPSLLR